MYSACLFCNRNLGRNEVIEHFPVGRRLAYDEAKGRLWVVCRHCERWNLTPLETRWEAIEEAERLFRASRLRIATENIGLARLKEGLELVRIGAPLKLELAGWRYGDQFGRRLRKKVALFALGGLVVPAMPIVFPWVGVGLAVAGAAGSVAYNVWDWRQHRRDHHVPTLFLNDGTGKVLPLAKNDSWSATLVAAHKSREWHLTIRYRDGPRRRFFADPQEGLAPEPAVLKGDAALRALSSVLPHANEDGASARRVREAMGVIEATTTLDDLIYQAATHPRKNPFEAGNAITRLPTRVRLALEMVVHGDDEKRAMEGELAELEQRWRDAEQIASIADALLVPSDTTARIEALRAVKEERG